MKLKLDENLGPRVAARFRAAGHDAVLVPEQGLSGSSDETIAEICRIEGRCIVTMDRAFSNPSRYPPHRFSGIIVLRLRKQYVQADVFSAVELAILALESSSAAGKLWLVQGGHIRQLRDEEEDPE